jgi:hypothetical protein
VPSLNDTAAKEWRFFRRTVKWKARAEGEARAEEMTG